MSEKMLTGYRVVEYSAMSTGAMFASRFLADYGAEVIKVEIPNDPDDDSRKLPPIVNGVSATYANLNSGKKSVSLDFRTPEGHEMLMKLLKTAKTLKAMTPQLEHMNQQLKLASIKAEAVSEKSEADIKRIKPLLTALPILLAINSIYNKDDELEGIKGYGTAARKYIEKKSSEQQLAKAVSKILRK